ncbi:MAG TPA: PHB depolymerase family esterase [Chloroflexota bacterium]|nr:PHB depolymerase family esterase [Chloroflexota bacterium]
MNDNMLGQPFQIKLLFLFVILFLAGLACARAGSPGPTPTASTPLPPGESSHTLSHDGRDRSYILYVPASVDWGQPVPLVFVFHGGTGNAQSAIYMSGFNDVADQHGFVVVYPNGTGRLSDDKLLTWNGGDCCAYAQAENVDDVGFVRAIVADLQTQAAIDAKRIYATGLSNGAMLTQRLACQAANIFAAAAPVAGTLNFPACNPSQPISIIAFHGDNDQHVPYEGGRGPASLVDVDFASVPDTMAFWREANGCNSLPQSNTSDQTKHEIWVGCDGATAVELYTIMGGGHAWPGGKPGWPGADQPVTTISASSLIWEFFAAHPRQ